MQIAHKSASENVTIKNIAITCIVVNIPAFQMELLVICIVL